MLVEDIMQQEVKSISPNGLLREVISLMDKFDFKEIPVVDDSNEVIGLINYFDILELVRFRGDGKVVNFMKPSKVLEQKDSLTKVLKLMIDGGITGFPVVEKNNKLVGFISDYDLLNNFFNKPELQKLLVTNSNIKNVNVVNEDSTIGEVRNLMRFHKRDRLPVVNEEGIFSGTILLIDLLRTFYKDAPDKVGKESYVNEVSKLMKISIEGLVRDAVFVKITDLLSLAIKKMIDNNLNGLIVVNGLNEPIGVLDRCSVLKTIYERVARKGFVIELVGDVKKEFKEEVIRIIKTNLKQLTRFSKDITGVKLFIKNVHETSENSHRIKLILTIRRKKSKSLIIEKEGFDILLTLISAISNANKLLNKR